MQPEELVSKLSGVRPNGAGYIARCPAHDDGRPSLSIRAGETGRALVHCFAGCTWQSVLAAVGGGTVPSRRIVGAHRQSPPRKRELTRAERLPYPRSIWERTKLATDTSVHRYLRSRGISSISVPSSIRFCAHFFHKESGRPFQAMVVGVQDAAGQFSGIQVTWLDGIGKATVDPQRKTFGPVKGGAVRLQRIDRVVTLRPVVIDTIVLCEGVETGLSILQATGLPVWATLGTSGLTAVQLPDTITTILIAADADPPGEQAARESALRLARAGKRVKIVRPPTPGRDFNDELRV